MRGMRPPEYHPRHDPKATGRLLVRIGLVIFFAIAAVQSVSLYVETLWFESLGYEPVYWYRLRAELLAFAVFGAASFLLLYVLFRAVIPASGFSRRPFVEIAGETIIIPSTDRIRALTLPVAAVLGILFGLLFSTEWNRFTLFFNSQTTSGVVDPIFNRPLSFYLFTLPVMESITGWILGISVVVLIAAILLAATDMAARFKGVSFALAFFLLAVAAQAYTSRYAVVLKDHALFTGARYVDHNIVLPGVWFVIAALVIGSMIAAVNIQAGKVHYLAVAITVPVLTFAAAGVLAPAYVTTFVVRPNELVRETPYIRNNIEFTRRAYGLDRVEEIPFEPRLSNAVFDPGLHNETLDNIRLWDWRALQSTLRQIQEIRTYYDFVDIDVDRYVINGKPQAMMLAARELSLNKLPAGSRNWVNERLIYTHGYGVTMNPVSKFSREGLPELILSNMPVSSTNPDVKVTRPEIYFGELTDWPVYVKTRQKEFNFPEGEANNYSVYEGSGGIQMGGFFRRLLLAWNVGDITKTPFSDDVNADSMLLMRRNIKERVTAIAPFLLYDDDPYIVVSDDGRLHWIMDAFTTSDRYPTSRHLSVARQSLNYIRNSVKVVIDAYNGTTDFYVFDSEDPLINAYRRMYSSLFKNAADMPSFLRLHVRYPELLYQIQALIYATYHVQNEQVFYNREDVWTIAQQGRSQTGQQASDTIEPFFILMQFPGEKELEFASILPFTPANRNNLIGWMAARSDGDAYGKLRAYQFPKTRFVDGPLQVQARIDQDPQLSSQFTLWNQQGSTVIRGNLLVMPFEDTLLYAEPVYLQAERSPMPELRMVVLVTQDRLTYAPRFPEALNALVAGQLTPAALAPLSGGELPTKEVSLTMRPLVDRANQALADYRRLTAEGKLAEAGRRLEDLKIILEQMNRFEAPNQ